MIDSSNAVIALQNPHRLREQRPALRRTVWPAPAQSVVLTNVTHSNNRADPITTPAAPAAASSAPTERSRSETRSSPEIFAAPVPPPMTPTARSTPPRLQPHRRRHRHRPNQWRKQQPDRLGRHSARRPPRLARRTTAAPPRRIAFSAAALRSMPAASALASGLTTDQRGSGFARLKDSGDANTTARSGHRRATKRIPRSKTSLTRPQTKTPRRLHLQLRRHRPADHEPSPPPPATRPWCRTGGEPWPHRLRLQSHVEYHAGRESIRQRPQSPSRLTAPRTRAPFPRERHLRPHGQSGRRHPHGDHGDHTEDTQTTSGLVISPQRGRWHGSYAFQNHRHHRRHTLQEQRHHAINNNDFITFAEGNAGLKFTPGADLNSPAGDTFGFNTQAALNAVGVRHQPATPVAITVLAVNDQPSFTASNPPVVSTDGAKTVAGWVTSFTPGPANESSQTAIAYPVSNVSNPGLFSADRVSRPTGRSPTLRRRALAALRPSMCECRIAAEPATAGSNCRTRRHLRSRSIALPFSAARTAHVHGRH